MYTKLEKLYLEENKIKKLENGLFNHLDSLKEVWLESNNIISIDRNVVICWPKKVRKSMFKR
jgi:hypothetical protein